MRRTLFWCLAAVTLGGVSGCTMDRVFLLARQYFSSVNEMADVLAHIRDQETAQEWHARLEVLMKKNKDIEEALKKAWDLKERTLKKQKEKEEFFKDFVETFEDDGKHSVQRFNLELARLSNPQAPAPIRAAWADIRGLVEKWEAWAPGKQQGPGGGMGGPGGGMMPPPK